MIFIRSISVLSVLALFLSTKVQAQTVSTGDLGNNVITAAGAFVWTPSLSAPSPSLGATLEVVHGNWSDPAVTVHILVNGTEIGTVLSEVAYVNPGPTTNTFSVVGLLVDGVNTIRFDGLGASEGEYVLGSSTIKYNLPLPPVDPPSGSTTTLPSGPGLLHYLVRSTFGEKRSGVSGELRLQANFQRNSSKESLDFGAGGLTPNGSYVLMIATDDETKAIANVVADARGRLQVTYQKQSRGGSNKKSFPPLLEGTTDLLSVWLQSGSEVVAAADIAAAAQFQYLVKRHLTPANTDGPAAGWLTLKANAQEVEFRLSANGLQANGTYRLVLNGGVVGSAVANANGSLSFDQWPAAAPAILELRSLSLVDASDQVVLGTSLPN